MKSQGKITEQITPEFIASVAVYDRNLSTAKIVLGEINTAYAADPQQADYLATLLGNGASVEDIRAVAKQRYGANSSGASSSLAKKLEKTQNNITTTTAQKPAIDPQNTDVFSFDQL